jgi:hypothetical protein
VSVKGQPYESKEEPKHPAESLRKVSENAPSPGGGFDIPSIVPELPPSKPASLFVWRCRSLSCVFRRLGMLGVIGWCTDGHVRISTSHPSSLEAPTSQPMFQPTHELPFVCIRKRHSPSHRIARQPRSSQRAIHTAALHAKGAKCTHAVRSARR